MDSAVERELAKDYQFRDVPPADDAAGREDAERDGQVERRAGLAEIRGSEVDRDPVRWKFEAGVANRCAHAIAALADARVGQAHHRKARQPAGDEDLDVNLTGFQAEERRGPQRREHADARCKIRSERR